MWFNTADDHRVQAALTHKCPMCQAQPGDWCRNTVQPNQPLPGRLLHHCRAER